MMKVEIRIKDESVSWEDLVNLLHEAFQERLDQGLHFTCSYVTAEDLRQQLAKSTILIAVDNDSSVLVGMAAMDFKLNKKGAWAYVSNLAVKPQYKRRGIMAKLLHELVELAKSNQCEYIASDTAVGAKSSVKWHKKHGFKIVGLHSFFSTNYYSYIFRKQLVPHTLWDNSIYCWIRFSFSALICRLDFNADGKTTKLMDLYLRIRQTRKKLYNGLCRKYLFF